MHLAVVESWLAAVDAADGPRLESLSSPEIEIVGPRGRGRADRSVLSAWLGRAGFHAAARRWFCGADGRVVVEQDARWDGGDARRLASEFLVVDGRVDRYVRHDGGLADALAASGLTGADEVVARS